MAHVRDTSGGSPGGRTRPAAPRCLSPAGGGSHPPPPAARRSATPTSPKADGPTRTGPGPTPTALALGRPPAPVPVLLHSPRYTSATPSSPSSAPLSSPPPGSPSAVPRLTAIRSSPSFRVRPITLSGPPSPTSRQSPTSASQPSLSPSSFVDFERWRPDRSPTVALQRHGSAPLMRRLQTPVGLLNPRSSSKGLQPRSPTPPMCLTPVGDSPLPSPAPLRRSTSWTRQAFPSHGPPPIKRPFSSYNLQGLVRSAPSVHRVASAPARVEVVEPTEEPDEPAGPATAPQAKSRSASPRPSFAAAAHVTVAAGELHAACPQCRAAFGLLTPHVLRCGHSLCQECCGSLTIADGICCPACEEVTELYDHGTASLPVNYALLGLQAVAAQGLSRRQSVDVLDDMGAHCTVCLEPFSGSSVPYVLGCGHSLCQACCDVHPTSCPLCCRPLQKLCINKPLIKTAEAVLATKRHQPDGVVPGGNLRAVADTLLRCV